MKFTLTTDTSCDWPRNQLRSLNIPYIPLTYIIEGEAFKDEFCEDAEYKSFYQKVRDGALPTTSQINPEEHLDFFNALIKNGHKTIVHLTLSGALSSTHAGAVSAAEDAMKAHPGVKIIIIDTLSGTRAHGFILKRALKYRDEGKSADETADYLNSIKHRLQVFVMADDLHHLKRGGRISSAKAMIGTLLKVKPIFSFNKMGGLSVISKVKGIRKALDFFAEQVPKYCADYKNTDFCIAQADCMDYVDELVQRLREKGCKGEIDVGFIGPVIGAHTGSGTIGFVFLGDNDRTVE